MTYWSHFKTILDVLATPPGVPHIPLDKPLNSISHESIPTEPFFITSGYSRILARELRLQERDLPLLLRGTGLPKEVLMPGDETRLSGSQQLRIIQNAREIDSAPELGLRMGRRLQPDTHGAIGYLALSSPDLLTALQALRDFLPLRVAIAELGLQHAGQWLDCRLGIRVKADTAERGMLLECFALLLQALVESVLGRRVETALFEFAFDAPPHRDCYPAYFHSPTRFGCDQNRVRLPAALLATPNAAGDADAYRRARDHCYKLLQQVPARSLSMTDRVKRLLLSMPAGKANEEDVAGALFVSKRTLARRLQREGSGYRAIREQLMAELAAGHLREGALTVEGIAALLGYHDTANFRRAFHRWYGCSPRDFRETR